MSDASPPSSDDDQEAALVATADASSGASPPDFMRRLAFYSLLGGLCPLIPVPFVDDIVLNFVRARMLQSLFREEGMTLSSAQSKLLRREPGGCLSGCFFGVILYIPRKIFRKVFFFLSIKGAADVASKLIHQGILMEHAIQAGHVDAERLATGEAAALEPAQAAYEATLKTLDHRPLDQVFWRMFRDSRRWSRSAARRLWGAYRTERRQTPGKPRDSEQIGDALARSQRDDEQMEVFVDDVGNAVWLQGDYLDKLRAAFDRHILEAQGGSETPSSASDQSPPTSDDPS